MLNDITAFYTEMFYNLNTAVKGIQCKYMVERTPKGKNTGMVHYISELF